MDKVLSIIIPTYNMENYLRKCLDSLIVNDENLIFLEVLVINDGSKDSSSQIAHQYEIKYPHTFRVIDKENGNYGSCINCGLKEAKGKYIKVLDADDLFETRNFLDFLLFLQTIDADCVLSDMVQVDECGNIKGLYNYRLPVEGTFHLSEIIKADKNDDLWMHCVCYKAKIFQQINYFQTEGISYTDQEWLYLPMSACKKIAYYPNIIYKYLVGREGQTIDVKVWEKNFGMEIKGLYTMLDLLNETDKNDVDVDYLKARLIKRTRTIYCAYFYRFSTSFNHYLMQELDLKLKTSYSWLYDIVSEIVVSRYFPLKIVKLWRHNYDPNRKTIMFLRYICRTITKYRMSMKKRIISQR